MNILKDFMELYYNKVANVNITGIFNLCHPNVLYTINNDHSSGSYNLLLNLTNRGIVKMEYNNLFGNIQIIDNNKVLVTVNGSARSINLWGQHSTWYYFSEVFVLEHNGQSIMIKNYCYRALN